MPLVLSAPLVLAAMGLAAGSDDACAERGRPHFTTAMLVERCNPRDWSDIRQEMGSTRREAIAALVGLVRSPIREQPVQTALCRVEAVALLGDYRAVEACGLLVEQIDSLRAIEDGGPHPLRSYPAAGALIQIGLPAIDAIISRLSYDVSDREMKLFAWVVERIDGKEVALHRLRRFLENRNLRPDAKTKLARLITVIEATDFTDPRQVPPPSREGIEFPRRNR